MNKILEREKKYNQQSYVEFLLNNGEMIADPKNYYSNLRLLAIYLKQVKKMKPKQREEFVYDFVKRYDPNYNEVTDYVRIDKALKAANKGKLKNVNPIKIYRKEFDYINNLPLDITRRKVLFSAFCFYKLRNEQYPNLIGNPYIPNNIVSMAKLKSTSKSKDDIRYYLNELKDEYFDWTPSREGSIIIPFVKSMPQIEEDDEDFCVVTNFDELYLYYDYFLGDKSIKFCLNCHNAFRDRNYKKVGARQKYCKDCAEYQKQDLKVIQCVNCGKTVYISAKSRRKLDLCDDCYEKIRKKDRHNTTT